MYKILILLVYSYNTEAPQSYDHSLAWGVDKKQHCNQPLRNTQNYLQTDTNEPLASSVAQLV